MHVLVALVTGIVFALGLGLSGLSRPEVVQGFLDFGGDWNPALLFAMAGAVGTAALFFRFAGAKPRLAPRYCVPTRREVDAKLVVGSALFGIGWGLAGVCPGPAITGLASGSPEAVLLLSSMLAGMCVFELLHRPKMPEAILSESTTT